MSIYDDSSVFTELNINGFADNIFKHPSQPPFSFALDFSQATQDDVNSFLQNFLLTGCKSLYNKDLHELSEREIGKLREYLLSIGWDADYKKIKEDKLVLKYKPGGEKYLSKIAFNRWNITFKLADQRLNPVDSIVDIPM